MGDGAAGWMSAVAPRTGRAQGRADRMKRDARKDVGGEWVKEGQAGWRMEGTCALPCDTTVARVGVMGNWKQSGQMVSSSLITPSLLLRSYASGIKLRP